MSGQDTGWSRLERTRDRLARWRERHGGAGIRLPEDLWAEAVEVARVEGVDVTARALRMDRARLASRVESAAAAAAYPSVEMSDGFVEVDAGRVCVAAGMVLRFEGRDGERLQVELRDATAIGVVALAEAFWGRRR